MGLPKHGGHMGHTKHQDMAFSPAQIPSTPLFVGPALGSTADLSVAKLLLRPGLAPQDSIAMSMRLVVQCFCLANTGIYRGSCEFSLHPILGTMCKTLHAVSPAEVLTLPSCSIPINSITNYKPSLVQIAPPCHLKDFTDFQLAPGGAWDHMGPSRLLAMYLKEGMLQGFAYCGPCVAVVAHHAGHQIHRLLAMTMGMDPGR